MAPVTQKKFSITIEQSRFLQKYKQFGYSDQSSIVREALNRLIKEIVRNQRRTQMARKARELLADYEEDRELTHFSSIDGDDFL